MDVKMPTLCSSLCAVCVRLSHIPVSFTRYPIDTEVNNLYVLQ